MPPVDMMSPVISLGGGMIAALVTGAGLMHIGTKHLAELPTVRGVPSTFKDVKREHKLNVGYMHSPSVAGDNAFFATKKDLEDIIKDNKDNPLFDPKSFGRMLRAAKQHGLVVTGKGFKKPGVIEHELGHAIATHRGTDWEKFTHEAAAPVLNSLGMLAGIGSGMAVALTGSAGPRRRALAALTGGGVASLFNVPLVSRELTANRYGRELMDDETNDKVKNWPFVGTYVNSGLTFPAVSSSLFRAPEPPPAKYNTETGELLVPGMDRVRAMKQQTADTAQVTRDSATAQAKRVKKLLPGEATLKSLADASKLSHEEFWKMFQKAKLIHI